MKRRSGLLRSGIALMVVSTVVGIGLFLFAIGPLFSGLFSWTSGSGYRTKMPGSINVASGSDSLMVLTDQTAGALVATCTVADPAGKAVTLQSASGSSTASNGQRIRLVGYFTPSLPGEYKISCDGSGEFGYFRFSLSRLLWAAVSLVGFPGFFIGAAMVVVHMTRRRRVGPPGGDAASTPNPPPGPPSEPPTAPPAVGPTVPPPPAGGARRPKPPAGDDTPLPPRYGG